MIEFILYAIKTIFGLAAFALIYRYVFMKELHFANRRIYLMLAVLLSFLLPLASFNFNFLSINSALNVSTILLEEITIYSDGLKSIETHSSIPYKKIIIGIYFLVCGFFILKICYQLVSVGLKTKKYKSDKYKNLRIYRIPVKNTSYSFFRNIFIGETPGDDDLEKILAHEKIHALQWHTLDVLIMEFLCVIFWFNPFIWWFRTEVKNVHEYLADDGALQEGYNRKSYQITLLEHLIGSASLSITNNFNYSLIKNRIAMMNQVNKGRKNRWKLFLLLPVSFALVFAFACTEKSDTKDISETPKKAEISIETAFSEVDEMAEFPGGFLELRKFIAVNLKYPEGAKLNGVSGKVLVQFVVNKEGKVVTKTDKYKLQGEDRLIEEVVVLAYKPAEGSNTENTEAYVQELKEEAVRVLSLLPDFKKPAMINGKPVAVAFTMPINFALQ